MNDDITWAFIIPIGSILTFESILNKRPDAF